MLKMYRLMITNLFLINKSGCLNLLFAISFFNTLAFNLYWDFAARTGNWCLIHLYCLNLFNYLLSSVHNHFLSCNYWLWSNISDLLNFLWFNLADICLGFSLFWNFLFFCWLAWNILFLWLFRNWCLNLFFFRLFLSNFYFLFLRFIIIFNYIIHFSFRFFNLLFFILWLYRLWFRLFGWWHNFFSFRSLCLYLNFLLRLIIFFTWFCWLCFFNFYLWF